MKSLVSLCVVTASLALTTSARAQFEIHTPYFRLGVGRPGVAVDAPGLSLRLGGRPALPPGGQVIVPAGLEVPPPVVVDPVPGVPVAPPPRTYVPAVPAQPVPLPPAPTAFPSVEAFAASFQAVPGHHEVWIQHPCTGCPVRVCFDLPPGCPRVFARKRYLEFDYGRLEVEIRFRCTGRVDVDYDD